MEPKPKKVSAILYDRISERVLKLAEMLNKKPNELINSFVEECLWQIDDDQIPRRPIETVRLARFVQRRNLTLKERLLQQAVKAVFPSLDTYQEKFRHYVLELANAHPGPLTPAIMEGIKNQADKMIRDDEREQRRRSRATE